MRIFYPPLVLASAAALRAYPEYCGKLGTLAFRRRSPPFQNATLREALQPIQVHLLFRHGARTPSARRDCWNAPSSKWDCSYELEVKGLDTNGLVGKILDGTPYHADTISLAKSYTADQEGNTLHSSCQRGQLLEEGAAQHRQIGRWLAESYLVPGSPNAVTSHSLLDVKDPETRLDEVIYVRSTDLSRTTLSAMNCLTGILEQALPHASFAELQERRLPVLETMDIENDYLGANERICPRMQGVWRNASNSEAFAKVRAKNTLLIEELSGVTGRNLSDLSSKASWPEGFLDCLVPSICADRWSSLPAALDPERGGATAYMRIEASLRAIAEETAFMYMFNDAEYSRLAMWKLVTLMRREMTALPRGHSGAPQKRLFLWSGHDTAIMPFLASLGPGVWDQRWPPYASLIVIEVFRDVRYEAGHLVRLLYNGNNLTPLVPQCAGRELCRLSAFLDATSWVHGARHECGHSLHTRSGAEKFDASEGLETPFESEAKLSDALSVPASPWGRLLNQTRITSVFLETLSASACLAVITFCLFRYLESNSMKISHHLLRESFLTDV